MVMQPGSPQEGFVRRLLFACCDQALKAGYTESQFEINGRRLSVSEMHALVTYARRHGFLPQNHVKRAGE